MNTLSPSMIMMPNDIGVWVYDIGKDNTNYESMTMMITILTLILWQWWWQYLLGVYDIGDNNNESMTMMNDDANSMNLWKWWWQ